MRIRIQKSLHSSSIFSFKIIWNCTVYIKNYPHCPCGIPNRQNQFTLAKRAACNVSRKSMDVGHHHSRVSGPGFSTNAFALWQTRARHRALKGTQYQFLAQHSVKTHPVPSKRSVNNGSEIGLIGHHITIG